MEPFSENQKISSPEIEAARVRSNPTSTELEPEWIRVKDACNFACVSKPVLYQWMNRGWIKNFSARQRGQIKGTRLIHLDSLRAFLESHSTGGEQLRKG